MTVKDWLQGVAVTALVLIVLALGCGMFYGIAWLLLYHIAFGVTAMVTLCLVVGGFAAGGARRA